MNTELIVVLALVVLSVAGLAWPKISSFLFRQRTGRDPDKFQRRMDLINDLLDACDGRDAETNAVAAAGDVIAKHWRSDDE